MVMTLNSHNNIDKTVGGLVNKKIIQLSKVYTAVLSKKLFEKSLHCSSWTTNIVSIDLITYKKSYHYTTTTTTTSTTTTTTTTTSTITTTTTTTKYYYYYYY